MSKVDWSLAPNWCNGYGLIGIAKIPVWFDKFHYQYLHDGRKHKFDDEYTFKFGALSEIIERPKQPQAWSGPEDGLPPIGTVCEFNDSCGGQWHKVEVMYVSKHTILIKFFGGELEDVEGAYSPEESVCFRPIKPSAQLRETAIRELMDIAQVDCRVTAARLVDAGFKREVV